jgi:hypothetical protein
MWIGSHSIRHEKLFLRFNISILQLVMNFESGKNTVPSTKIEKRDKKNAETFISNDTWLLFGCVNSFMAFALSVHIEK